MPVREKIIELFSETLEATNREAVGELTDSSVLLETGLDSLGFAILVARLEEELGFDPFTALEEAVYPRTFGEFVKIYQDHGSTNS